MRRCVRAARRCKASRPTRSPTPSGGRSTTRTQSACLLRNLDALLPGHVGPARDLVLHLTGEHLRRAAGDVDALLGEVVLRALRLQRRVQLLVEEIDDRLGRRGRREETVPGEGL